MCALLTTAHDIPGERVVEAARAALSGAALDCSNPFLSSCIDAIYVHVPFCKHRCHYCDFFTLAGRDDAREAYVDRLLQEAAVSLEGLPLERPTVFIGGGTPTYLAPRDLERLLEGLQSHLPDDVSEWTIEANPETVDEAITRVISASPVTRVSLGMQSAQRGLLQVLERQHDPASVPLAVDRLRQAGIDDISLDLIFGIPGQTLAQVEADLEAALALDPQHLSVYGLVYEPGTPLRRRRDRGLVQQVDETLEADMYRLVRAHLAQARFEQYELSNWARDGHRCKHNGLYWSNGNWWQLGPAAAGHVRGIRWRNAPRLGAWLESTGLGAAVDVEQRDLDGQLGEQLMLGLRRIEGVARPLVDAACDAPLRGAQRRRAIQGHQDARLLEYVAGDLRLTADGQLLADTVIGDLL